MQPVSWLFERQRKPIFDGSFCFQIEMRVSSFGGGGGMGFNIGVLRSGNVPGAGDGAWAGDVFMMRHVNMEEALFSKVKIRLVRIAVILTFD